MLDIKRLSDDQIEIAVTGRIEKAHIEAAIKTLDAITPPEGGKLNVIVDLTGFSGMSIEAFIADIRYAATHFGDLDKYERFAILTDADWIEALVWIENKTFAKLDIRCFEPEHRDHAMLFINGEEPPQKTYPPAIHRIPADREDMIAFRVTDKIREADAKAMVGILTDAYSRFDKVDLLVALDDFEGFDPRMLFEGDLWRTKMASFSHVRKYALVGGPGYLGGATSMIGAFLPFEIKTFSRGAEKDAWVWLGATPLVSNA